MIFTFGDYHKFFFSDHRAVNKIFDCSLCFYCEGENEIEELPAFPTSTDTMSVASGSESEGISIIPSPKIKKDPSIEARRTKQQSSVTSTIFE